MPEQLARDVVFCELVPARYVTIGADSSACADPEHYYYPPFIQEGATRNLCDGPFRPADDDPPF